MDENFKMENSKSLVESTAFGRNLRRREDRSLMESLNVRSEIIETVSLPARSQAPLLFQGAQLPGTNNHSAESTSWACDALNRTATIADPGIESPREMWHGSAARDETSAVPETRFSLGKTNDEVDAGDG